MGHALRASGPPPFTLAVAVAPNSMQLYSDRWFALWRLPLTSSWDAGRTQLNCADAPHACNCRTLHLTEHSFLMCDESQWKVFPSLAPWVDNAKPRPQDYLEGACILTGLPSFHVLSLPLLFFASFAKVSCLQTCNFLIILNLKSYKILACQALIRSIFSFFFPTMIII